MDHQKTKHIEIWMHYFRKPHAQEQLVPIFFPSVDQLANIFTKYLPGSTFTSVWKHIGVEDLPLM
jgi:hypothetical protein